MSEIDCCPRCQAPLKAVRIQYFEKVVLAPNFEVLSAELSTERDVIWQIHCERGHRLHPPSDVR